MVGVGEAGMPYCLATGFHPNILGPVPATGMWSCFELGREILDIPLLWSLKVCKVRQNNSMVG